jgi:signal transduction histidine kinase
VTGSAARDRAHGPLLVIWVAVAACAAAVAWVFARDQVPWYIAWLLAAMFTGGTGGWLAARRCAGECARLQADLDRMQVTIAGFANSSGRFVGNIAHEIKTPLAIVVSQTDLLLGATEDPAAVRRLATSIAEDMRHLSDLVDSFLRLARPFAQDDASHHVPVHVHDFVVEAVRRCRSLAIGRGVSVAPVLEESGNGEAAPEVVGDAMLLEAMLENLLRNAVRFSPRGSRVVVRVQVRGGWVLLNVRDHGSGIAAEYLESVFDWFFQAPGSTLPPSGTGFGLAIARRVAEHHRGSISLRNHPEGGCEFVITLPRWYRGDLPAVGVSLAGLQGARPSATVG